MIGETTPIPGRDRGGPAQPLLILLGVLGEL